MSDQGPPFNGLIAPVLSELGIQPSELQLSHLQCHYDLLQRWSRRMNLTTIRRPQDIVRRHFGESLYLSKFVPDRKASVVDVGSGAGFPGVPIAIMRQAAQVTLVESVRKKATFLKEATRKLENVHVLAVRAEDLEGRFDWATVRAVSPLRILPQLVRLASTVAFLVTDEASQELQRCESLDWVTSESVPWGERRCLLIGAARSRSRTRST